MERMQRIAEDEHELIPGLRWQVEENQIARWAVARRYGYTWSVMPAHGRIGDFVITLGVAASAFVCVVGEAATLDEGINKADAMSYRDGEGTIVRRHFLNLSHEVIEAAARTAGAERIATVTR